MRSCPWSHTSHAELTAQIQVQSLNQPLCNKCTHWGLAVMISYLLWYTGMAHLLLKIAEHQNTCKKIKETLSWYASRMFVAAGVNTLQEWIFCVLCVLLCLFYLLFVFAFVWTIYCLRRSFNCCCLEWFGQRRRGKRTSGEPFWALAPSADTALWHSCSRCCQGLSSHKATPSRNSKNTV